MSLSSGTRLGPYEIVSALGAGGMGEVYRARDTKLDRDVAIKVLPESFALDADRVARFTREAKTLASLNHPNIAAIYGIESNAPLDGARGAVSDSRTALVMELVEGEDLSAHIARGAIPLADALPIARQIADALEAAHEQGIVHRDLKPANVKVRADGTVKVLDFGLAKALDPAGASSAEAMNSPTLTARATQMGMIIGTAAYMSPEQARGRAVDRRADIWAFGVVFFEMLTGRRAFEGEDISITLASVLKEDVDWSALPADLPAPLHRLLRRCLEKDPKKRLSSIGDARLELDEKEPIASPAAALVVAPRSLRRLWIALAVVAALWLATLVPAALYFRPAPEPLRIQFAVTTPAGTGIVASFQVVISPDGKQLVYSAPASPNTPSVLWVRPIDSLQAQPLAGTEAASHPFWSPDSRHIGFAVPGVLKRVDVSGGPPQTLCNFSGTASGATWNSEGVILFASGIQQGRVGLSRVSEAGGVPVEVLSNTGTDGFSGYIHPRFLPDGRHYLYVAWSNDPAKRAIYAASLDGGPPTLVVAAQSMVVYASSSASFFTSSSASGGLLLYQREGALMAHPFDASSLKVTGEPARIADDVLYNSASGRAAFSISETGVLVYRAGGRREATSELAWISRAGKPLGLVGEPVGYNQMRLSPDGRRVVFSRLDPRGANNDLWTLDLTNNISSQLTFDGFSNNDPAWAPDSSAVLFESTKAGRRHIYRQSLGSRSSTLVFESPDDPKWLDDVSRDGRFALFHLPSPAKLFAIPLAEAAATSKPLLLAESSANVDCAHFSPDGKWVVYCANDSGEYDVWVAAFPAFDHRQRVSAKGGGQAFWRADGRELFYLTPTGQMMSVAVAPAPGRSGELEFKTPVVLFQSPLTTPNLTIDQYSVTRDGQRFLFIQPQAGSSAAVPPITVVVNAFSGMKK